MSGLDVDDDTSLVVDMDHACNNNNNNIDGSYNRDGCRNRANDNPIYSDDGESRKEQHDGEDKGGYILGTDFGSTTLNVKIFTSDGVSVGEASEHVPYLDLPESAVEIEPDVLFDLFVRMVKGLLVELSIQPSEIISVGFTFQKGTMMLWDEKDGKPRTNLISWQDTRCVDLVEQVNSSYTVKAINLVGAVAHAVTRKPNFLVMKILKFDTTHSSMRLLWQLQNNPELYEDVRQKKVLYGCLDTWIVWKLTAGRRFVTDYSGATGTALFDPYTREWSPIASMILGVPYEIFPEVVNTCGDIGLMDPSILGTSIPITAIVSDTQAGLFALNCHQPGEFSFIMGTGCFIDINTGTHGHASIAGLYPQIGWCIKDEVTYVCEGHVSSVAASVEWGKQIGLYDNVSASADLATSVEHSDGVFFVPAFHGLSAPHQDKTAAPLFIGMKTTTTKAHMVRALLEGIAFRFVELYFIAMKETEVAFQPPIKISGGVSNNSFLMQLISSLTECIVEKSCDSNVSLTGAMYLAGLGAGVWRDIGEVRQIPKRSVRYYPDGSVREKYKGAHEGWMKAVERCKNWKT